MKRFFLTTAILVAILLQGFAQSSNIVAFSEGGERFWLVLNGVRQNENPETNVRVTGLNQPYYKAKVIFEDSNIPEIDKNIPTQDVDGNWVEATFVVKPNKKGEYVFRPYSNVPIAQAPPAPPSQTVVVYTATPRVATTVTETTTTTSSGDNVNVSANVNLMGVNMNVNVNDNFGGASTTTTTTTTTSSTTGGFVEEEVVVYVPGYNGAIGCPIPMSPPDFQSAKQSIGSKSFEDSKLTIAKQIFTSNCLTSQQVKETMMLFTFEDSKLDFAKFAYGRTYDLGNYFKVNDAFTYESSIDELNSFINGGGGGW